MTWNYRLIEKTFNDKPYYEIHEVYYNENNEITGITENAMCPYGDTKEEITKCIKLMLDACNKPTLVESGVTFGDWQIDT